VVIQQDTLYGAVKFSGGVEDAKHSGLLLPAIAFANTLIVRSRAGLEPSQRRFSARTVQLVHLLLARERHDIRQV
jgi:hypothetical protein